MADGGDAGAAASKAVAKDKQIKMRECTMSDPRNWMIFRHLEPKLIDQIRLFYVFGEHGRDAVFATDADDVYAIGYMAFPQLGFALEPHRPKRVPELSQKMVVKFAYGATPHLLALTEQGQIFQLGSTGLVPAAASGRATEGIKAYPFTGEITAKKVIDIACLSSQYRAVALTDGGELYSLSFPGSSSRVTSFANTPLKSIAVMTSSVCALSRNGEVFIYQWGGSAALSAVKFGNHTPTIVQVACAYPNYFALSGDGVVCTWQGTEEPITIKCDNCKVVEMAADYNKRVSAALTHDGQVYMWGQGIEKPTLTPFATLQEALSFYAQPSTTYKPIVVAKAINSVVASQRRLFDDKATSDITFSAGDKSVYAHKAVLKTRCEYIQNMFNRWEDGDIKTKDVKDYSYPVYRAFLKFFYTDEVDIDGLEELITLLDLAESYCEDALKASCEALIKKEVTVANVADLYLVAVKYDAFALKEFCLDFAGRNVHAISRKQAYGEMPFATMKDFIAEAVTRGIPKE